MKKLLRGTNALVISLAVIGLFIILTIFLHSLKGVHWDLTKNKNNTLSGQTITTLKSLKDNVHAIAFTDQQGSVDPEITNMLQEYHKRNSKFTYEIVNPAKNPTLAQKYKIDAYSMVVLEDGDKTKSLHTADLYAQGDTQGAENFNGEQEFTQAIITLTSKTVQNVYFITGHGELTSEQATTLTSSIEGEGYTIKDLNLATDPMPTDAKTVFVLGPQQDIPAAEAKVLETYLKGNGKIVLSIGLAKDMGAWKNWPTIFADVGIKNQFTFAVDPSRSLQSDPLTIVPIFSAHDITNDLQSQNRVTELPDALGLTMDPSDAYATATPLLLTSDKGYGIKDLNKFLTGGALTLDDIKQEKGDDPGPLDLAFAVQDQNKKPKAVIIGNTVLFTDNYFLIQGNKDFILNSLGWLQEQKDQITIRPRVISAAQQITMTRGQILWVRNFTDFIFPLLILLLGFTLWWRRRKG